MSREHTCRFAVNTINGETYSSGMRCYACLEKDMKNYKPRKLQEARNRGILITKLLIDLREEQKKLDRKYSIISFIIISVISLLYILK